MDVKTAEAEMGAAENVEQANYDRTRRDDSGRVRVEWMKSLGQLHDAYKNYDDACAEANAAPAPVVEDTPDMPA